MEERRAFEVVHVQSDITVRYKFLCKERQDAGLDDVHETVSRDISRQGMVARIRVPNSAWVVDLLTRKMYLGLNLLLPGREVPIKALGEIASLESFDDDGERTNAAIRFKEISAEDAEEVFRFLIRAQGRRTI